MKEKWRWVRGFKGYYKVSTRGRVKSVARIITYSNGRQQTIQEKILKPRKGRNAKCYFQVFLSKHNKAKSYQIHRLVLEAFVGPCPKGMETRHFPDRNRTNNHLNNLQWDTHKNNQYDRIEHGTDTIGENNGMAVLTKKQVKRIRKLYKTGLYRYIDLVRKFRVSKSNIHRIILRKTWKSI